MFTVNIKGQLKEFSNPILMGIINVTPDSFFADSRISDDEALIDRAQKMIEEGAEILDIGACSTRPGSLPCSEKEEMLRLRSALSILQKSRLQALISVDTFRSSVARMSVVEFGVDIINDVSGGEGDKEMFQTIAELRIPYILTHPGNWDEHIGNTMNSEPSSYQRNSVAEVCNFLSAKKSILNKLGVSDVIIDPGIGFGKTTAENFKIIKNLEFIKKEVGAPVMVGLSRKSMITNVLKNDASDALNGTTVMNTVSLIKGADILRVHDVKASKEAVVLLQELFGQ